MKAAGEVNRNETKQRAWGLKKNDVRRAVHKDSKRNGEFSERVKRRRRLQDRSGETDKGGLRDRRRGRR